MKFTIRQMLYGMIGFALIAAVAGAGANGSPLAYGLAVSIGLFLFTVATLAALYWLVWLCWWVFSAGIDNQAESIHGVSEDEVTS